MTEAALVTNLLEVIAQDDLFDAVLDTAKVLREPLYHPNARRKFCGCGSLDR